MLRPSDNLWILVIVQKFNGQTVMLPLDVPVDLNRKIESLLRAELQKPIESVIGL